MRLLALLLALALLGCSSIEERARTLAVTDLRTCRFDDGRDFWVRYGEDPPTRVVAVSWGFRPGTERASDADGLDARLVLWDGRELRPSARWGGDEASAEGGHGAEYRTLSFAFETDVARSELCAVAVIWSGARREVAIPEK